MKHKNFIPKRIFILAIITIASICVTSAQRYRGFADFNAGFPIANSNGISFDGYYGYELSAYSFGLSTSHGIQLTEQIFLGAGIGIQMNGDGEKINGAYSIPMFANFRYDFKSISKTNFFVACKIGYLYYTKRSPKDRERAIKLNSTTMITSYNSFGYNVTTDEAIPIYTQDINQCAYYDNSFYIEPSIGLRIRLSSKIGLNIAVYYSPIKMKDYTMEYISKYHQNAELSENDTTNFTGFTTHKIGLSLGIDF